MIFSPFYYAPVAFLFFAFTTSARLAETPQRRASVCNGQASFCDRSYGNITFVGTHDSYAIGTSNGLFFNQDQTITQQLNDGVRMLQVQVHNKAGTLQLCHSSCSFLDGGSLLDYLKTVKIWMDANPNEVLSILMVNIDDLEMTVYDPVFKAAGLDTLSYSPPSATLKASEWPTLGSMIDSGKRLVTFVDATPDFDKVPYIVYEFSNIWETAFDVTDTSFNCDVNRTKGDTDTQLYLINHFLDRLVLGNPAPDKTHANTTNAESGVGSVGAQVSTCVAQHGKNPNFILVDWYEFGGGGVFKAAAKANGVSYNPTSPIATPITATSSSATATSATATGTSGSSGGANSLSASASWKTTSAVVLASLLFGAWTL